MKRIFKYTITTVFACTIFLSCSDDYLDLEREAVYSSDNYYNSEERAIEALTVAYSLLLETYPNHYMENIILIGDLRSDDAEVGGELNNPKPYRVDLNEFNIWGDNVACSRTWIAGFTGIRRATVAIETINTIPTNKFSSPALKKRLMAEAYFLKALNYQYLVKAFGKLPLIDHVLSPEESDMKRAEVSEVYALIKNDLDTAIKYLPWQSDYASSDLGRASKGAAIYLKTNVLIHEAKTDKNHPNWQEAYDLAHELVLGDKADKEYELLDKYLDIWKMGNEYNKESMFEIVNDGRLNVPTSVWYHCFLHPRWVVGENGEPVASRWGWSNIVPSQNLVDAFEPDDPRFEHSIYKEGDSLLIGEANAENPGPRLLWFDPNQTGYYRKKLVFEENTVFTGYYVDLNIMLFRYADLLLYFAESAYYVGKEDEARQILNKVRKRAREGDESVLPDRTSSGEQLLKDIWHERRVELSLEHHRFFDLVRQGRAAEVITKYGKNFEKGKHELLPLPEGEVALAPSLLPNNPGY